VTRVLRPALVALLVLVPAVPAGAHDTGEAAPAPLAAAAGLATPCPGRAIAPEKVITGEFGTELNKSYVMVPFDVPLGTTAVRVKYCWDRPESGSQRHTLDLGLYEPRKPGDSVWGEREFRGWGGSSHPDVTVSAEGFSSDADYTASPRIEVPGKTTRAFLPGPIRPGQWAVELGVGAVIPQSDGDADGKVGWRVEIEFADDPAFADEPYKPTPYDKSAVRRAPGWYSGDFHVHAEHSAYGDATMSESFSYAFRPVSQGGAGLDFITLSDYVSGSAWGEIGRWQRWYPNNLIIPSAEIITYRGHTNNHGSQHFVDYRTGPIYQLHDDGTLKQIRGTRDPRQIFDEVHRFGGWTQINHPTIFPPVDAAAAALCRGCFWEYTSTQTDYSQVDAWEVATGPGDIAGTQNPFTVTAIARYEQLLTVGYKIAAVGSSDSHKAGSGTGALFAPIGEARTVVRAKELSMRAIRCGVLNRHTYAKVPGASAPDIRFVARPHGANSSQRAIIGDTIHASGASFKARVLGGNGDQLLIVKDGVTAATVPVTSDDFVYRFDGNGSGRWRLQVMNGSLIQDVSTPIWVEPGSSGVVREPCR
jgi:hypothetical protein